MKLSVKMALAALLALVSCGGFAPSAEASQVDALIEKLVEKRILTRMDAEAIRSEIETEQSKTFKAEFKKAASWADGLTSKGDVRLRYEAFNREDEDTSDRNRFRFRVRWGLEKKFSDEWRAGFAIASGSGTNDATSTNQSFDGEFGLKDVFIDKAYAIWSPTKHWQSVIPAIDKVDIGAGKVTNPYDGNWATTIIWDGDVTPEGLYELVDFKLWENKDTDAKWMFHTLLGQWVVDEDSNLSPGDVEMYSYGFGTTYQWAKGHALTFKFTYYDWQDYIQFQKTNPSSLSNSFGGNDREVEDFKIINFYGDIKFDGPSLFWGTQPYKIYGDYAHNTAAQTIANGTNGDDAMRQNPSMRNDEDDAFSVGFSMGNAKDEGTWATGYEYLYIEPNAVVGNFAESDIGVGFANNKGHKLWWKYMLWKNVEFNATAWLVERVNETKLTYGAADLRPNGDDDQLLRTQVDLVYKF